ncbi:sentrin-specific protease 8-like [Hyalella azteca]|uniref:Sentrin-specific protease 8-like n=1 Tax=Hyalella azteca TaxID=294128 RepID=A0A8B7NC87_HYAAZ|nr:sentrin-specific protease 8-like [Hyalella azteca]
MSDPVVLSFHDSLLHESDLRLLKGRHWLNDALISFWLEYLQHTIFPDQTRVLCVGPEVTQLLKMCDPAEVAVVLDPLEANHKDFILLPVNDNNSAIASGGSHWSLLVFSRFDFKWYHYDSMRGSNYQHARSLVQRINRYLERDAVLVDATCTQQDNSYDCGAFVLLNAEHAASAATTGAPLGTNCVPRHRAAEIRQTLADVIDALRHQSS